MLAWGEAGARTGDGQVPGGRVGRGLRDWKHHLGEAETDLELGDFFPSFLAPTFSLNLQTTFFSISTWAQVIPSVSQTHLVRSEGPLPLLDIVHHLLQLLVAYLTKQSYFFSNILLILFLRLFWSLKQTM